MTDVKAITLGNLAEGAAEELFGAALVRVLENLQDGNTDHKAKRRITIDVIFGVDEQRHLGEVEIRCTTKLAGIRGVKTLVSYGRSAGRDVGVEHARTLDMFDAQGKPALVKGVTA